MGATGWVRIWRSLRECRLARRGPAWELLMIHLVMDAEWQGPARGTLTVSVRDYARREGLEREKLRWMLDEMAADGFIALETVSGGRGGKLTSIRILKYADYQGDITEQDEENTHDNPQDDTHDNPNLTDCNTIKYDYSTPTISPTSTPRTPPTPLTTTEEEFNKSLPLNAHARMCEEWRPSGAPPGLEAYPTRPEEVTAAAELLGMSLDAGEAERFLLHWRERDWTLPDGARVRSWRTSLAKWLRNPRRAYFNGEYDGQRGNQGSNGMAARWSEERRKRVGGDPGDYYAGSDVEWLRRQGILPG